MNQARRHSWWALVVLGAPLALGACAGVSASDDDDEQDAASSSDAGADYCDMVISFSPTSPVAPATVYVDGSISRHGGVSGVEEFDFDVTLASGSVTTEERDPYDGSKIQFEATEPGPYRVTLYGSVGSHYCTDGQEIINVLEPGANTATYRLRFVPAPGQPAPAQERTIAIPGGASYDLGSIALDSGVAANGAVRDMEATPLPAYLRMAVAGAQSQEVETFAGVGGSFSARLPAGSYDVLVVPGGSQIAPVLFHGLGLGALAVLVIDPGDAITGVVLDPSGAPLAGARVSVRAGGVPSTIAVTDASGAFALRARAGSAAQVHVSPPAGSGLPQLELGAGAGLAVADASALTIRYSAGLTSRAVGLDVLDSDGATPVPLARTTWIGRPMSDAGTVTLEGGSALAASGTVRVTAVAGAGGELTAVQLVETEYDVIVEPATALSSKSPGLRAVDLSAGMSTPAAVSLAEPATITGTITRAGGTAVEGASVTAVPRGALANVAGASATAISSATGVFSLSVVGAGEYDLLVDPRVESLASTRVVGVTAPAAGASVAIPDTSLRPAIAVTGAVTVPGVAGGAQGVHVMVLCHDCDGMAARIPVADAVTDISGRFSLAVPDPGVAAAPRMRAGRVKRAAGPKVRVR